MSKLLTLGLTGGIASGKSTAVTLFRELCDSCVVFDADACVKKLYQDPNILDQVAQLVGYQAVVNGEFNADYVRSAIFEKNELKIQLQQLIHPLVRKECLAILEQAKQSDEATLFIADVPLLFEGEFNFGQELNLVVAVSRETQILRLKKRNGFDDATVHAILEAQFPIEKKLQLGDIVFWNEGPKKMLKQQIQRFLNDK